MNNKMSFNQFLFKKNNTEFLGEKTAVVPSDETEKVVDEIVDVITDVKDISEEKKEVEIKANEVADLAVKGEIVVESDKDDQPSYAHKAGKDKRAGRFLLKKKFKKVDEAKASVKEEVGMKAPEQVSYSSHNTHSADDHYHAAQAAHSRYFDSHSKNGKNPLDAVIYHANMAKHHEHMAGVSADKNQGDVAKAHMKSRDKFLGHLKHYSAKV